MSRAKTLVMLALMGTAMLASMIVGCNSSQSRFAHLNGPQARELARRLADQRGRELQEDLQTAFAMRRPRNILVLSGGGADGAFGCGVLDAWRRAPGGRPTFDVVTGVSTGALMATFAFLGREQDDAALREVYTHTRDADIHDGPFTPGPPDSVFDTGPLKRLISRYVTDETIERVARAHRAGRRLYVATVDLDAGAVVIWPLSKLAAGGGPTARERVRQVLLAAASVPVLFPPVEIDGDLHVDAGLREAIFVRQAMLGFARAYDATCSPSRADVPPAVWAIVNGQLSVDPQPVDDDLVDIGVRSLTLYTQSLQLFNVREVAHLAAAHNPPFEFRYIAMPAGLKSDHGPGLFTPMFDPARMGKLYQAGHSISLRSDAWQQGPPPLDEETPTRLTSSLDSADH